MNNYFALRGRRRKRLRAMIIQGGNNAEIARHAFLCNAHIVIVLDVENEIQRLFPGPVPVNFKVFCLASGETARTLAERGSEATRRCLANTAGMNAESGLGQRRGFGWLAGKELLNAREMQEFLDHGFVDHLMQVSGGELNHVDIDTYGSVAGGTASALIILIQACLERTVVQQTNATVQTVFHITGGISYTGLGPRVHKNAAAGTVEILAHVIAGRQDNRVIRAVRLSELSPVGEDRAQRARYMLEIEQANHCAGVSEALERTSPNRSQDGRLGNVTIMQSGHFTPLDPRFDVAQDIAPEFARILRRAIAESQPQPSLLQQLRLNSRRQELPRENLEGILSSADSTDADDLIAAVAQPGSNLILTVDALLASGETIHLSDALTVWASSPGDLSETMERLILQSTCLQALEREIAANQGRLAATDRHVRQLARQVNTTMTSVRRPSVWKRIGQLLATPVPLPDQLAGTVDTLRRSFDQYHEQKMELQALQAARNLVQAERDFLIQQLTAMAIRLESIVPRGQQRRRQPTVVARPIDTVYRELWTLTAESADEEVVQILLAAVDHVTELGLAKITGANPARLEFIASRIAQCQCEFTPAWGGKLRTLDGLLIHVLPPLAQETGDKLKDLIRKEGSRVPVVVAERMPASLNCTTLVFTPVVNLEGDVFTQLVKNALLAAYHDANREMYFPSGLDSLRELGITIDDEIHFADLPDQGDDQ